MKKLFACIGIAALAATFMASAANAIDDVTFWFANSSGQEISTINLGAPGAFSVDVWMTTNVQCTGFDSAIAYGPTIAVNQVDDGLGNMTPDVTIPSGTGQAGAVFNSLIFVGETPFGSSGVSGLDIALGRTLSGALPAKTAGYKLATINFNATNSGTLSFYNAGAGDSQTSFVTDAGTGAFYRPTSVKSLNVVVPEPSALLALGSGLMGLAGFAVRRRRA